MSHSLRTAHTVCEVSRLEMSQASSGGAVVFGCDGSQYRTFVDFASVLFEGKRSGVGAIAGA